MGIKIDLPIKTIEEANLLNETIQIRIDTLKAHAAMLHATDDERVAAGQKVLMLEDLQARMLKGDDR